MKNNNRAHRCPCPYATLNLPVINTTVSGHDRYVSRNGVSDNEIRDAYKTLSRRLHPDKRPPGRERDDAQEIFTELLNAYEILSDPVLRQAYDNFGHRAVARIRHNRYESSSLYLALTSLHQQGRSVEALETLTTLLEDGVRETKGEEWKFGADLEVSLHVNPRGSDELVDVSQTNVGFKSTVPISQSEQQKMELSIGGRSNIEKGMGSTRGSLSALYKPSQQTQVSSELTLGRKSLETSLSSVQHMASGTVLSAKVARQYDFESNKNGKLSFGFNSSRSLALIEGRRIHGMFALNLGWSPPTTVKLHYGQLSLTTWGLSTKDTKDDSHEDDEAKSNLHHPPKLTAKLALGQFPFEIKMRQDYLFDSPERSIEASISYNPFAQTFRLNSMLSRDLSKTTSISFGSSHAGMRGLTWLLRYERAELSLSVPIFVANFMAPNYWNRALSLSILSYLVDETIGEILETESKESEETPSIHETIAAKEHSIVKEQQWLHSSHAKFNCSQQIFIMESIAKEKRSYEESTNGLVILDARYQTSPARISINVTLSLQFWVQDSHLAIPAGSKALLLGFYDLCPRQDYSTRENNDSGILHTMVDCLNHLLACFGIGQTNDQLIERQGEEKYNGEFNEGSTVLSIRYKYNDAVFESLFDDQQPVSLPSPDAFMLGSGKVLS